MKKNNQFVITRNEFINLCHGIDASFDCLKNDIKDEFEDLPYKVIKKIKSMANKYKFFAYSLIYAMALDDTSHEMQNLFLDLSLDWLEDEEC